MVCEKAHMPLRLCQLISHELWLGSHAESVSNPRHLLRKCLREGSFIPAQWVRLYEWSEIHDANEGVWGRLLEWSEVKWVTLAVNCYSENDQFFPWHSWGSPRKPRLPHTHTQLYGLYEQVMQLPTHIHSHSLPTVLLKYSCWEACSVVSLLLSHSNQTLVKNLRFSYVLSTTWTSANLQKPLATGAPAVPYRKLVSADQHCFLYMPFSEAATASLFSGSLESMC